MLIGECREVTDSVCEWNNVHVVTFTSALSFEPLCKLNDGNSQKDLQLFDFALLCVTIALLCVTFLFQGNNIIISRCYYFVPTQRRIYATCIQ